MMEIKKERISKVIARAGLCSRRDAEKWIIDGRILLNDTRVTTPATLVDETDVISVDNNIIPTKQPSRLWCYHKPVGLVTTHKDPAGRPTVFDNLPKYLPRVISVGRLDLNSEGLLLLTTNGELARSLEHPSKAWKRKYRVRIHGKITPDIILKLKTGIVINGIKYAPVLVEIEPHQAQGTNQWIQVTLTEGKNREIRKIMNHFGFHVSRLIRISYGPFQLGNLPVGEVREISKKVIKEQCSCEL